MKRKIYAFAASLMAVSSCGFLDVDPDVMVGGYTSEEDALYGLAGVYGVINNEPFYGNYYSLMLSNVDDLCYFNRTSTSNYSVWYQHDAGSPEVYAAWKEIYKGIGNANSFMEDMAEKGQPFFAYLSFYAVHAPIQTTDTKKGTVKTGSDLRAGRK